MWHKKTLESCMQQTSRAGKNIANPWSTFPWPSRISHNPAVSTYTFIHPALADMQQLHWSVRIRLTFIIFPCSNPSLGLIWKINRLVLHLLKGWWSHRKSMIKEILKTKSRFLGAFSEMQPTYEAHHYPWRSHMQMLLDGSVTQWLPSSGFLCTQHHQSAVLKLVVMFDTSESP